MKIVNSSPDPIWVPALGVTVEPGDEVETTKAIGSDLVAQGWTESKAKATDKKEG